MKWGKWNEETAVRRAGGKGRRRAKESGSDSKSPSFSTKRLAKKDAKEYATAKMYYGEGAGNRRKLIKNTVEQRRKDRPGYSEEFDRRLSNTNWDKTVKKARSQRARNTTISKAAQTGRGIVHALNGNTMYASAAALTVVGGYKVMKNTGMDKVVAYNAKRILNDLRGKMR